ncbi:MAG: hypothetical protein ACC628_05525 [Pirellulaceae bacterium]
MLGILARKRARKCHVTARVEECVRPVQCRIMQHAHLRQDQKSETLPGQLQPSFPNRGLPQEVLTQDLEITLVCEQLTARLAEYVVNAHRRGIPFQVAWEKAAIRRVVHSPHRGLGHQHGHVRHGPSAATEQS